MPRESISKKLRFDVFKRDYFKCQYCGNSPPSVVLEVDHIHPVSKGGKNSIDNLLTACFDCNRGKAGGLLGSIPESLANKIAIANEKESQLNEFNKFLKKIRKREDSDIDAIELAFNEHYPNNSFKQQFRESIRNVFLKEIMAVKLVEYMYLACSKVNNPERAVKYFCGICWNVIREQRQWLEQEQ